MTVVGGMINTDYQGEIGLSFHSGCMNDYVWSARDPLLHFLVLSFLMMKVNWKLQQLNPGRVSQTYHGLEYGLCLQENVQKALTEFGVNTKSVVGEGSYKYQLRPFDQLQK